MGHREELGFTSGGARCAAWLYRPDAPPPHPLVVLGHGLTAVREMRLDAYAERFRECGLAALAFDYRGFGASAGEPRGVTDIDRQLEDWAAAIAYARSLDGVDSTARGSRGAARCDQRGASTAAVKGGPARLSDHFVDSDRVLGRYSTEWSYSDQIAEHLPQKRSSVTFWSLEAQPRPGSHCQARPATEQ